MKRGARRNGFSLLELLVVIAIVAILSSVAVMSLRGVGDAGQFNQSLNSIEGILDVGRSYATAQNTYVWVVLYQNIPANGVPEVYVGTFASTDGTDPLNWNTATTVAVPSATYTAVSHISRFRGLLLQTSNLPGAPTTPAPNYPATATTASNFTCTAPSENGPVALSNTKPTYWVVQFTPSGMARNSANPISFIWLGLQPAHTTTAVDTKNVASIEVSGLTGGCTIYRP